MRVYTNMKKLPSIILHTNSRIKRGDIKNEMCILREWMKIININIANILLPRFKTEPCHIIKKKKSKVDKRTRSIHALVLKERMPESFSCRYTSRWFID